MYCKLHRTFPLQQMAKAAAGLSPPTITAFLNKPSPLSFSCTSTLPMAKDTKPTRIRATFGGEGDTKRPEKKFITREEEPAQYWQTAGEREGENPMKTPLPYIIIFGMSTPFVILAIAFANGWIKVPVR